MFSKLKSRLGSSRFWLIFLGAALATSLVVNVAAIAGVRSVVEPPAKGQFQELLKKPPIQNPVNVTDTLFEHTVDELSGGVIPVLLFPNYTDFCGERRGPELIIAACVDRFDATYIALSEEVASNWYTNYQAALEAGLEEEAEEINKWERQLAAHEFAHILQYNYRTETLPFQNKYFLGQEGFLGQANEAMAECYAQLVHPMVDEPGVKVGDVVELNFYGFPSSEVFPLCTQEQLDGIEEWLAAIDFPLEGKGAQ